MPDKDIPPLEFQVDERPTSPSMEAAEELAPPSEEALPEEEITDPFVIDEEEDEEVFDFVTEVISETTLGDIADTDKLVSAFPTTTGLLYALSRTYMNNFEDPIGAKMIFDFMMEFAAHEQETL